MSFSMTLTVDEVTPRLRAMAALGRNITPVLRAMGTTFKSITEGNFNSAGARFRPKPWAPKRDGSPSNLQLTTTMAKSFHLEVTNDKATVSNPMIYAAIHQFGGVIRAKNRPFLRFQAAGQIGRAHV